MWEKQEVKNELVLMWGNDNGDDIYIEHVISDVDESLYNFLCKSFGIPCGKRKSVTYYSWIVDQVS